MTFNRVKALLRASTGPTEGPGPLSIGGYDVRAL